MEIEEMKNIRSRINERLLIKKASAATEAQIPIINTGGTNMTNLNINLDNVNTTIADSIKKAIQQTEGELVIRSSDIGYADHFVKMGELQKAKDVLNSIRNSTRILIERIDDTEKYIDSLVKAEA